MLTQRINQLREKLENAGIDAALITDDDSIYYYSGYYDYLHMDFGRPTLLIVPTDGESVLITPHIDYNMAVQSAKVDRIEPWNDGKDDEWRTPVSVACQTVTCLGIETHAIHPLVRDYIDSLMGINRVVDLTPIVTGMRMIKSEQELQLARHAGEVAVAMMDAGREAIKVNVPEFEVALATTEAGTRKAAQLLDLYYQGSKMSPNTHFLQIMASGHDITLTHHRASTKKLAYGDPVFVCFCGMTNFHRFKLGFDRMFWIGELGNQSQRSAYEVAVNSQKAALERLRPGVMAQEVHAAYVDVIQSAGYEYPFRCGRATGFSFLERPQLVFGDKTVLQPGMVFAVDGSVTTGDFRAQVGDSVIVTESGHEVLTPYPKEIEAVVV